MRSSWSRGQVVDRILASDALLLLEEEEAAATGVLHCGGAREGGGAVGLGADGKVEGGRLAPEKLGGGACRLDDLDSMREQKDGEVIVFVSVCVSLCVRERLQATCAHVKHVHMKIYAGIHVRICRRF